MIYNRDKFPWHYVQNFSPMCLCSTSSWLGLGFAKQDEMQVKPRKNDISFPAFDDRNESSLEASELHLYLRILPCLQWVLAWRVA